MKTQTKQEDARRHQRHKVAVCAWLDFHRENTTRGTVSEDLAVEGARFCSMRPVAVGEGVLVRMQLEPSAGPIECKGRICWTRSQPNELHTFGVRFVDLSEEEQGYLASYLGGNRPNPVYATV